MAMTTTGKATQRRTPEQDIEELLPWHAVGTLSRRDAARVEAALSADPELARRFSLVREEQGETIHLNETLGAPSGRAMEKLFAAIDADVAVHPRRAKPAARFGAWLTDTIAALSPRTLAWTATAAALAIALQAGLLVYMGQGGSGTGYETASYGDSAAAPGTQLLIGFTPEASAADITRFLEARKAQIVDGPRAGGLYKVRIAETALPQPELARALDEITASGLVRFAGPTE
jgi:anti-sigma factor RsiW